MFSLRKLEKKKSKVNATQAMRKQYGNRNKCNRKHYKNIGKENKLIIKIK
jgi:hypothetical protein